MEKGSWIWSVLAYLAVGLMIGKVGVAALACNFTYRASPCPSQAGQFCHYIQPFSDGVPSQCSVTGPSAIEGVLDFNSLRINCEGRPAPEFVPFQTSYSNISRLHLINCSSASAAGPISLRSVLFEDFVSTGQAGALLYKSGTYPLSHLELVDVKFFRTRTNFSGEAAGALAVIGNVAVSTVDIACSQFSDCEALAGTGGAIHVDTGAILRVDNSWFTDCSALNYSLLYSKSSSVSVGWFDGWMVGQLSNVPIARISDQYSAWLATCKPGEILVTNFTPDSTRTTTSPSPSLTNSPSPSLYPSSSSFTTPPPSADPNENSNTNSNPNGSNGSSNSGANSNASTPTHTSPATASTTNLTSNNPTPSTPASSSQPNPTVTFTIPPVVIVDLNGPIVTPGDAIIIGATINAANGGHLSSSNPNGQVTLGGTLTVILSVEQINAGGVINIFQFSNVIGAFDHVEVVATTTCMLVTGQVEVTPDGQGRLSFILGSSYCQATARSLF